jgi:BASS family bile acid:Na+ symporter
LCVTLSAVTSVITVFTIPFLIDLALRTFAQVGDVVTEIPLRNTLLNLMSFTLVPLAVGMLIRVRFPSFALRAVEPVRRSVLYLMMAVLLLGAVSSYQDLLAHFATAGGLVITMNLLTMALGYGLATAFKLPKPQVVTITFEVGVQNLALAFAITFNILRRPDLAVTALLYAVVMPATALAFVGIARRLLGSDQGPAAGPAVAS